MLNFFMHLLVICILEKYLLISVAQFFNGSFILGSLIYFEFFIYSTCQCAVWRIHGKNVFPLCRLSFHSVGCSFCCAEVLYFHKILPAYSWYYFCVTGVLFKNSSPILPFQQIVFVEHQNFFFKGIWYSASLCILDL